MKTNLRTQIETVVAGIVYVAIGTALATQVNAQNSAKKTQVDAAPVTCETNKSPDAMCSLPLQQGPEAKICFSIKHSRCFEVKDNHLLQTISGQIVQDSSLAAAQLTNVKSTITSYTAWLDSKLSKMPKAVSLCRDIVSIDSKSEHKEFCLSKLPTKDVQAKTKDVLATLQNPGPSKAISTSK